MTPREPPLDEKIVLLTAALGARDVPHAFGGALALAYHGEPRSTVDVDLNVFAAPAASAPVLDALRELGARFDRRAAGRALRDSGQARVPWGTTPVDLFFSTISFHEACARGARLVPFGEDRIPILAAEHLLVCKAAFDRRKDWIDIEQVLLLTAGTLDLDEVRRWLREIVGPRDRRMRRFDRAVREILG